MSWWMNVFIPLCLHSSACKRMFPILYFYKVPVIKSQCKLCTKKYLQTNLSSLMVYKNCAEISCRQSPGTSSVWSLADTSKISETWCPVLHQLTELQKTSKLSGTEALLPASERSPWFEWRGVCVPWTEASVWALRKGLCVPGHHASAPVSPSRLCYCISQLNKRYYFFFKKCIYILRLS